MIYILFDYSNQKNTPSFISKGLGLDKAKDVYSTLIGEGKKSSQWILGCLKAIRCSEKGDTLVCWFDFQAVICFFLAKGLLMHRKIVCINLMLKDKPTLRNRLISAMYKCALLSKDFTASVTSVEYGKWLNKKLGIYINYTLIHDVFHDSYTLPQQEPVIPNCVFCGGRNGRDWNFMMEIAREMPSVQFYIVMPNEVFERYAGEISENIHIRCNIPLEEFMKEMSRSALVCLPLNTEAPAGLIVLFRAAANRKMVITTDTATTKEYVTEDRGERLIRDVKVWKRKIAYYLGHPEEAKSKANNLYEYLKEECSEEKFVNNLKKMIQYEQQMD